jgi:hypothetical protein
VYGKHEDLKEAYKHPSEFSDLVMTTGYNDPRLLYPRMTKYSGFEEKTSD